MVHARGRVQVPVSAQPAGAGAWAERREKSHGEDESTGEGGCWGGWPVREPDPGTGSGLQKELEKGVQGGRKRNRRRKTTPELPDQVIAVRCQSAAERGTGLGRERRDTRRVRAVWDRESTSVKNNTLARWGPSLALNPPLAQAHLPTVTTIPAADLRGEQVSSTVQPSAGCCWGPMLWRRARRQAAEELELARVHMANHGRPWLWAPGQVLTPEATQHQLRMDQGPPCLGQAAWSGLLLAQDLEEVGLSGRGL